MKSIKKKHLKILIPLAVVALIVIASIIYVSDYYIADPEVEIYVNGEHCGQVAVFADGDRIIFTPENPEVGLIFYPGGKVEFTAYAPLLESLAEEGVMCILLKMPLNLAVLDQNAASGIVEQYPEIDKWYMCGHSLGGAMAASHVNNSTGKYDGIILLAAYSTKDIATDTDSALIIYGSNDEVLNRSKFEKYKSNLPSNSSFVEIEGGCHAYFGNYGAQSGDGEPAITRQEQQRITRDEIIKFIFKRNS